MKIRTLQLLAVSATYFSLSPALAADVTGRSSGRSADSAVAETAPQTDVASRGDGDGQGALVSGDVSLMRGRSRGYGGAAQVGTQLQTSANAQVLAGRPSYDTAGFSIGIAKHGKSPVQGRGNGRL